jgi:hypothetical protein
LYGLSWLAAITLAVGAPVALGLRGQYVGALCLVAGALVTAAVVIGTDWPRTFVDSQVTLQRGALDDLAQRYWSGGVGDEVELGWQLRLLSYDGHAYARDGALFIPVWQDWRAKSGTGLAYFEVPPTSDAVIQTADGDAGQPKRMVAAGWWWVE